LLDPPHEQYSYSQEDFELKFNAFLERIEDIFPEEAQQMFGNGKRYFDLPA
jgi:hypothetical protein